MTLYRTLVIFFFVSIVGIALAPMLSVDLSPAPQVPAFTISYTVPDASPETVEAEATAFIENTLAQLADIEKIRSVSNYNGGRVEVTFAGDADIAVKRFEIVSALRNLYPKLNRSVSYPMVENRQSQSGPRSPLLIFSVNAPVASYRIGDIIRDKLIAPLSHVNGIEEIRLSGAGDNQVTVWYDLETLAHRDVKPDHLARALQTYNRSHFFQGQKSFSSHTYSVTLPRGFNHLDDIRNVPVYDSLHNYRLKDLAAVYLEEQAPQSYHRINGLNSVMLSIYADQGTNRIAVANAIKERVGQLGGLLPAGVIVITEYDDTEYLKAEINKNYTRSIAALVILFLFVALAYRNVSSIAVLMVSQFVTLGLTGLLAWIFGISVHLYTLAGLTISFGLIIDNSIIMLDYLQRGKGKGVIRCIIAATLTTVAALLLVFVLPDEERINLTEFCLTVTIALGASVFTAVFFIPAAYRLWGKRVTPASNMSYRKKRWYTRVFRAYESVILFLARYKRSVIVLTILCFGLPVFLLPPRWENHEWYNRTVGSVLYQDKIKPWVDRCTGGALRLFVRNVYERSGYRTPEKTRLFVNASLPKGFTLNDMNTVMLDVEAYLSAVDGIDRYITHVYSGEHGAITILFDEDVEMTALPYILKNKLIVFSLDKGGVNWNIYGVGRGFSSSSSESIPSFRVEMKGYNYLELEKQAGILAEKLLRHQRIQQVDIDQQVNWNEKRGEQLTLNLNATALAEKRVNAQELVTFLKEASPRINPDFTVLLNNTETPVYLQSVQANRFSKHAVEAQSLRNFDNEYPMAAVGKVSSERKMSAIHRDDRQYIRIVGFEYFGSYKFGKEYLDRILTEMGSEMPPGYSAKHSGGSWDWNNVKRQYGLVVIVILAIYLISGVLFESLKQPVIVLVAVPVSFIGLFLTFGWLEFYFDQGGYAAFILLGGLTTNASILVLTDYNLSDGINRNRNYIKATWFRTTPILLTVISTCAGLIPFIMGGQHEVFWFSLAAGTMGGLLASLFAVFVLCPVISMSRNNTFRSGRQAVAE